MYTPSAPICPMEELRSFIKSENIYTEIAIEDSSEKSTSLSQTTYECPKCFKYLLPPIYQCRDGHTLCNSCISKVKRCPTCREDLPTKKIRSLVLEELVVGLRYDCKNRNLGCFVKNLTCDQISKHASNCPFGEIPYCAMLNLNCTEKFAAGHIFEHLKSAHSVTGVNFGSEEMAKTAVGVFQSFPALKMKRYKNVRLAPHYLKWNDKLFFLKSHFDVEEKTCSWMVCRAADKEIDEDQLIASIKLKSRVSPFCSLEWRGQIGNLGTPFAHNKFSFNVPLKTFEAIGAASSEYFKWRVEVQIVKKPTIPQPSSSVFPLRGQENDIVSLEDYSALNSAAIDVDKCKTTTCPPVLAQLLNSKYPKDTPRFLLTGFTDSPKHDFVGKLEWDQAFNH